MTLADRIEAFKVRYPDNPDAWPWISPSGRWLYGVWEVGNDYKNRTDFYGAYPPRFLEQLMALFPDMGESDVLHVFSGSLPAGPYTRVDINPLLHPDVVGSVLDVEQLFPERRFGLQIADPPYSDDDAVHYGTTMPDRFKVTQALATVAPAGGFLAWLDCVWPMHTLVQWQTVGRIFLQRGTNHRVRVLSLFERAA